MTPRELDALRRRHIARERMQNYRAGLQPSIYINAKRKKGSKAVTPLELFGEQLPEKPARIATADEIGKKLDALKVLKDA